MPTYQITHTTAYHYDEPVSLCYNEGRLLPRSFRLPLFSQECAAAELIVKPLWDDARERIDYFGNRVTYFTLRQPHAQMRLTATSEVTVTPLFAGSSTGIEAMRQQLAERIGAVSWEEAGTQLRTWGDEATLDARQYALSSPFVTVFPALLTFARKSFTPGRPLLDAVVHLMTRIYGDFDFVSGATTIATPLTDVLAEQRGVCQDFAHLMLAALRSQGLAARYVSGYIETVPPPSEEKLQGSDASHAWCSLYIPGLGWVDFDPTNNLIPQDQHVVLGWGRDFGDVTPLKGVFFGDGRHTLEVAVDMVRV